MRILAKSLVRNLQSQGYEVAILLSLITELIEAVTVEMQRATGRSPQPSGSPRAAHPHKR
ncbi:hypothetical protein [Polyangium jinanense]|uniref:Uncharacterized protein n=1 Tax=Polyangium jinanense TaxID=2829994 RepID=A0A9X3XIG4_9BACT|nr:hypothetical protein [Polyangium jinanense]MDC3962391.1 hypothetical protein [Polyangium jinanense]MDC3989283.1 hypothetical protein [Polyangium jinanense]